MSDYPMYGYEYNEDGYHYGPVKIEDEAQLERFFHFVVEPSIKDRREVMITDEMDIAIFHFRNGLVLWDGTCTIPYVPVLPIERGAPSS